jgi:uncharacterized membrane protein YfcA
MSEIPDLVLDASFFALAVPAVLFAGISKGGFGSGGAFAATPILALAIPPGLALGLLLPLLMVIDAATLRPYWRQWSLRDAQLMIAGGIPGVALGAALYRIADADLLRLLIGVLALGFVVWRLALRAGLVPVRKRAFPGWVGAATGLVAGFTSFISHAGGPPVAVYLLSQGHSKTRYQATTVLTFWALNIAKAVPCAVLGLFTLETLTADLMLAPVALCGAWLGVKAHRVVPERAFFGLTYLLLVSAGGKLVWDALA